MRQVFGGKNVMRSLLAFVCFAFGFVLIYCILFVPMPADKRDMANLCLGFDFGLLTGIAQYYFGTSQSSSEKTELITPKQ